MGKAALCRPGWRAGLLATFEDLDNHHGAAAARAQRPRRLFVDRPIMAIYDASANSTGRGSRAP